MNKISVATFNAPLDSADMVAFRGALLKLMGRTVGPAYHHHDGEALVYGYPLIQYKMIDGRPAVLSIDTSLQPLADAFGSGSRVLRIGGKEVRARLERVYEDDYAVSFSDDPKFYTLSRYLPLNEKNVVTYDGLLALTDKICFLENIITANILAFFKGVGYHADQRIEVAITAMKPESVAYYKNVAFRCFDLELVANVSLPENIGLGKSPSVGFGTLQTEGRVATDIL